MLHHCEDRASPQSNLHKITLGVPLREHLPYRTPWLPVLPRLFKSDVGLNGEQFRLQLPVPEGLDVLLVEQEVVGTEQSALEV